jgi:diguanylate cyclase (GGDEF)-like protein/PAS domain S-box-containing protein
MTACILVVDDDASTLMLIGAALVKAGYEVVTAKDGERGLALFREHNFQMVMLDVEMPGLSGFDVCARLRAEAGDELPIVMVTGMDDIESIELAYESGATDFIAKPIHWTLIGHRVRYLLRGRQALLDVRSANARSEAILRAIPDLLFEMTLDGCYLDCHTHRSELLGTSRERLIGKNVRDILPPDAARIWIEALGAADREGFSSGQQFEMVLPCGLLWFELSISRRAGGDGMAARFIVLLRDITERKDAERRIARLAYFDALTGLANRQSFLERVDLEIAGCSGGARRLGVLFMDLDGFKAINDTMGHGAGDQVLRWAADRLRQALRPGDIVSSVSPKSDVELARLGGDEFTALIVDIVWPEDALAVANRVLQMMRQPFNLNGRSVLLTASIGIAVFPEDGVDGVTLLKHADTAMYHAKEVGRDNCQYYSAVLTEKAVKRLELEGSLRQALQRGEFHLMFQPQLDVSTGRIVAAEALIRWDHPTRGTISPLEFIPVAEANGLIVPIGQWVLRTACVEAARWQRQALDLRVAVNLSPLQFKDPELLASVRRALEQTGLPPQRLELEITEGALMTESSQTLATLNALRDLGVSVSLDDFGTGYSSMSYLKRLPLSTLKIDRSFVEGLPHQEESMAIVRAILSLAKSLGFSVTAEGVETPEQARSLKHMSCDMVQGYLFSKPVTADDIVELMANPAALAELRPLPPVGRLAVAK